ncbi:MAG: hypothetical protein JNL21_12460, partial [Myxococcales bacterium]|nr:hypothetical protein [Myxococcales bacterium]
TARAKFPSPESLERAERNDHPHIGALFRWYVVGVMLMGLGFADWALVAFHASRTGVLDAGTLPLLYAGAMAVDALGALAFGTLFDRYGLLVLAATTTTSALFAPLVFLVPSASLFIAGSACWALGMGAQDSIFKAAIAKLVPKEERGRAYGIFFALFGLAWWLGSTAMGWLYERSTTGLVAFSVLTQLAAVPILLGVGLRLRKLEAAAR